MKSWTKPLASRKKRLSSSLEPPHIRFVSEKCSSACIADSEAIAAGLRADMIARGLADHAAAKGFLTYARSVAGYDADHPDAADARPGDAGQIAGCF